MGTYFAAVVLKRSEFIRPWKTCPGERLAVESRVLSELQRRRKIKQFRLFLRSEKGCFTWRRTDVPKRNEARARALRNPYSSFSRVNIGRARETCLRRDLHKCLGGEARADIVADCDSTRLYPYLILRSRFSFERHSRYRAESRLNTRWTRKRRDESAALDLEIE